MLGLMLIAGLRQPGCLRGNNTFNFYTMVPMDVSIIACEAAVLKPSKQSPHAHSSSRTIKRLARWGIQ